MENFTPGWKSGQICNVSKNPDKRLKPDHFGFKNTTAFFINLFSEIFNAALFSTPSNFTEEQSVILHESILITGDVRNVILNLALVHYTKDLYKK